MLNRNSTNPNDRNQAQNKLDALNGLFINIKDQSGRSSLMSSFLALAMVDDSFRNVLSKMPLPKTETNQEGTLDALLENVANASMDRLAQLISGERSSDRNVQAALDRLAATMIQNVGDQRTFIETRLENGLDGVDRYMNNTIHKLGDAIGSRAERIGRSSSNRVVKLGAKVTKLATDVLDPSKADIIAKGAVSILNEDSPETSPETDRS